MNELDESATRRTISVHSNQFNIITNFNWYGWKTM